MEAARVMASGSGVEEEEGATPLECHHLLFASLRPPQARSSRRQQPDPGSAATAAHHQQHKGSSASLHRLEPAACLTRTPSQHVSPGGSPRLHRLVRRSEAEEFIMSAPEPASHGAPRRYVSGMRLECKPVPWRFSSGIHLKLGSTKRRYTEKVYYKMRLVPWGYFEGATADFCHEANPAARRYIATMTLQCTNVPHLRLLQPQLENGEDSTDA